MSPGGSLLLVHGPRRWPLGKRALSIGRLPECDIPLAGDFVSRNHAYVIPTPSGPLLVDGSRLGTMVNGERMNAPWILAEGDEIRIGLSVLRVVPDQTEPPASAGPLAGRGPGARVAGWLRRYGPSEVLGTVAAVGAAGAVRQLTGSTVAGAYAGAIAEALTFYGIMFLGETIRDAHQAGRHGRPYGVADLLPVFRNLVMEFGVAEAIDALVLRPLLMGLGMRYLGTGLGALLGKLAADAAFYGPVLAIYEWRLARGEAVRQRDRRRRTTATGLVVRAD
jgi:FHA domain